VLLGRDLALLERIYAMRKQQLIKQEEAAEKVAGKPLSSGGGIMDTEIFSSSPDIVRCRASYSEYVELAKLLNKDTTLEELVTWFHQKLDRRRAYGSENCASHAYESLQQFVEDFKAERKISELVNGSERVTANRVISKQYTKEKKYQGCKWETSTLYSFYQNKIDKENIYTQYFLRQDSEICNKCGKSVAPGSGRFVNRIPDFNSCEERIVMGKLYHSGEFVCAEYDLKIREGAE